MSNFAKKWINLRYFPKDTAAPQTPDKATRRPLPHRLPHGPAQSPVLARAGDFRKRWRPQPQRGRTLRKFCARKRTGIFRRDTDEPAKMRQQNFERAGTVFVREHAHHRRDGAAAKQRKRLASAAAPCGLCAPSKNTGGSCCISSIRAGKRTEARPGPTKRPAPLKPEKRDSSSSTVIAVRALSIW